MINLPAMKDDVRKSIRVQLFAKGISVSEAATKVGIHRTQLSRILHGHSDTTFDNWEKLAGLIGKTFVLVDKGSVHSPSDPKADYEKEK